RIDDTRPGQHEMNEPYVPEVVRHLVDEKRLAGAIDARIGEIFLAELGEILGRKGCEDAWITRLVPLGTEPAQTADDLLYVGQLLRAFHLRVRGEDLLDERRAGARQSDDEDRIGARIAPAGARGKELRGADFDLLLRIALDQSGLITAFGPLELVPEAVVIERTAEIPDVLVRLAEREA